MDEIAVTPFIPSEHDASSPELGLEEGLAAPVQLCPLVPCFLTRSSEASRLGNPDSLSITSPDPNALRRDEQFYLYDGSCILRIENTLFNVHRSILSKDFSSFATLFTLPQGDTPEEGTSDENPIVLQGDTPEEFRNFLWALYALPHEIMTAGSPQADLNCLVDVAKMASKYSFKSIELWALEAIQKHVECKPSALFQSPLQISRLVRLAQMCRHQRLLDTMVSLLRQLMTASLHYSHLAMSLADELDLHELRGLAYLEVLQKSVFMSRRDEDRPALVEGSIQEAPDGHPDIIVNPVQQHRLLSGYYRLSKTWERLRSVPLTFEHAPSCAAHWQQQSCTRSWTEFWKEKVKSDPVLCLDAANVLGRLSYILNEFDKWGTATYMGQECRAFARRAMQEKIRSIGESLSEYFCEGGEF